MVKFYIEVLGTQKGRGHRTTGTPPREKWDRVYMEKMTPNLPFQWAFLCKRRYNRSWWNTNLETGTKTGDRSSIVRSNIWEKKMEPVFIDLHIHTSDNPDDLNLGLGSGHGK